MSHLEELSNVLRGVLSTDNVKRNNAERMLTQALNKNPQNLLKSTLQLLRKSKEPSVRTLCAVLLRKNITRGEPMIFLQMSEDVQNLFKLELLKAIAEENTSIVRSNISDTVAELAKPLLFRQEWPQLISFLGQAMRSNVVPIRYTAYDIIGKIADESPDALNHCFENMVKALPNGLNDSSLKVQSGALVASAMIIQGLDVDSKQAKGLEFLLVPMLKVFQRIFNSRDDGLQSKAVKAFVDIATDHATFFRSSIDDLARLMSRCGQNRELEPGVRNSCLEVLVSTCSCAGTMARKSEVLMKEATLLALKLMLETSDDPDWVNRDNRDDIGQEENSMVEHGELSMDRLALGLGGKKMSKVVFPLIGQLVGSADWKMRRAGLMALSQVGEVMEYKTIPTQKVAEFLRDPHPRVRFAAANCMGQLSNDFAPMLQNQTHAIVIPELMRLVVDNRFPRVQTHAAAALFNYVENANEDIIDNYVDDLIPALLKVLQNASGPVQEQLLTTIACVSGTSPKKFLRHYETVMRLVMSVLRMPSTKKTEKLRARAMECVSYIGMGVGKERFRDHANELIEIFKRQMQCGWSSDDTTKQYMLQAWARIATIMKAEFMPYMQYVIPHVFDAASKSVDIKMGTKLDGSFVLGITSELEEKATACSMLCSFASNVKEGYYPFVEKTLEVMLPLMSYGLHEEIKAYAISIMPDLIGATKIGVLERKVSPEFLFKVFRAITEKLVNCMKAESNTDILMTIMHGFQNTISEAGPIGKKCFTQQQLAAVGFTLLKLISKSQDYIYKLEQNARCKDADEELIEEMKEKALNEEELMFMVADCIGTLIRTQGTAFLPVFEELGQSIGKMLKSSSVSLQKYGVFIIDDLIEYIGPDASRFFPAIIPSLCKFAMDMNPELQQAALYGLGVCAEKGGEGFDRYTKDAIKVIIGAIERNRKIEAGHKGMTSATDNAISAFGKFIKYRASCMDVKRGVYLWINQLPIKEDIQEAKSVYSLLCELTHKEGKLIFGENMANLPQELAEKMRGILVGIRKFPNNVLTALNSALPPAVLTEMARIIKG
ncbi:hypothetical protein AAMO2058_000462300 [Amorphochlora amoebiformis]